MQNISKNNPKYLSLDGKCKHVQKFNITFNLGFANYVNVPKITPFDASDLIHSYYIQNQSCQFRE